MDNADILTAACAAREHYGAELRAAEQELAVLRARVRMLNEFLEALTPRPKRTRAPRAVEPAEAPEVAIEAFEDAAA